MHKTTPMNRLLQGDVGSGKTVVATIAMYLAYLNGYQSVLMAPTEILANQHYQTVSSLLTPFGVKVGLVTGTKKLDHKTSGSKNNINNVLNSQSSQVAQAEVVTTDLITDLDILIGTHALLYNKKRLRNLGLVVIDEQHRFGVNQRSLLRQKGKNPHVLTMTATPIPRTVALTMYKDLNLSYLDEMPKGRKIIKTWLVPLEKRGKAYEWIRKQVQQTNSQAFIICPFIEISETMQTVKAATAEYERLKKEIFPDLRIGLLHGKMKSKDKNAVLQDFKKGKYHILVATPVVEVGIDIPNATIIVIEASERFGLAQLHQLRGRVGRGEKQSFCLLFTESKNEQTLAKLKELERIHIGAELAELDLRLRGPGEIYGTLQSGIPNLKIASFSDVILIEQTRKAAEMILSNPAKYPYLLHKLRNTTEPVSPD
jgi:ATP-dependent DNA helicase RecG